MTQSTDTSKHETTKLENTTYNILAALGREADFLYSTIDTYINDAQKANRQDLVKMWNTIKQDRERHLQLLREALEKEAKQEKLSSNSSNI
jgi:rubrerythrin